MVSKRFLSTMFTLSGSIMGAGILGLPYVFAKAGFFTGLFWLLFLGGIMIYVCLCLGEVSLRTKEVHQLTGYAEKYLGKNGKRIMFLVVVFGVYSALLAYLIGEGQSLSKIITGSVDSAIYFSIGFWLFMTVLLRQGLKGLKKVETYGVMIVLILILIIAGWYSSQVDISNIMRFPQMDLVGMDFFSSLFFPFGVILFAIMGFTAIPELRMEIRVSEKKLKKAIIIGVLIPIIVYIIFSFVFVGVLNESVNKVATLSFFSQENIGFGGLITILLGVFTMLTSYFVLSFALMDTFKYDLKVSDFTNFFFVSAFPLLGFLVLSFFNLLDFVSILGIGGVISGGLTGMLILIMAKKAKKSRGRKPEYKMPINWFVIGLLSLIFIIGIVMQLVF